MNKRISVALSGSICALALVIATSVHLAKFPIASDDRSQATGCGNKTVKEYSPKYDENLLSSYIGVVNSPEISIVRDPAGNARRVLKFTSSRYNFGPTPNPRTQISTPGSTLTECTEFWTSFELFLPRQSAKTLSALENDVNGHINYAQIYGRPYSSTAPLIIEQHYDQEMQAHRFSMRVSSTEGRKTTTRRVWTRSLVFDRWVRFAFRMKMSTNPNEGFVQLYFDAGDGKGLRPQRLTGRFTYHYATLSDANYDRATREGNHMDLQVYRPVRISVSKVVAYFTSHKIGNSLESVIDPN